MGSSRKKRGKQRKASNAKRADASHRVASVVRYQKDMTTLPPAAIVEAIGRKEAVPTEAVTAHIVSFVQRHSDIPALKQMRLGGGAFDRVVDDEAVDQVVRDLVAAGLITTLVDLLNEGRTEEFGGEPSPTRSPSLLMNFLKFVAHDVVEILANAAGDDSNAAYRVQIASTIGPLFECMRNEVDREYFKSTEYWHQSVHGFVSLVACLTSRPGDKEALDVMLGYDGLFDFMLQAIFWQTHRSDLVAESKAFLETSPRDDFADTTRSASHFIHQVLVHIDEQSEDGKRRMREIATTPIVGNAHCDTVLIFGVLDLLKVGVRGMGEERQLRDDDLFGIMLQLIVSECIDVDVVEKVVNLGYSTTRTYRDAGSVIMLCNSMLLPTHPLGPPPYTTTVDTSKPNDRRFARAIDAGLFEMCLGLLVRFGAANEEEGSRTLVETIHTLMKGCNTAALQKLTAKSLALRSGKVMAALQSQRSRIPNTESCQEVFKAMQSILRLKLNDADIHFGCANCRKALTCKEALRCIKCKTSYCSRECQVIDWREGNHKVQCKQMQSTGFAMHDRKDEMVSKNAQSVGKELIMSHTIQFIVKAIALNLDIQDCICVADLLQAPPKLRVMEAEEFYGYYVMVPEKIDCFRSRIESCALDNLIKAAIVTPSASQLQGGETIVQIMMVPIQGSASTVQSDMKKKLFSFPMAEELLEDLGVRKTLFEMLDGCADPKEAIMKVCSFSKSMRGKLG